MKKTMTRLMAVAILTIGWTAATAQNSVSVQEMNRILQQRKQQQQAGQQASATRSSSTGESAAFGTFFLEYNPTTMHVSYKGYTDNTSYQGLSVGGNYFMPFAGSLGFDAGLKLQYFFRNETKGQSKYKSNMLSATVPLDLAYDWHVSDAFAVYPYAGLYARVNILANGKEELNGKEVADYNAFDKDDMGGDPWKRFQFGWQAGINFRIIDMLTIGGGYWMDLNELTDHVKLRGFNVTLGVTF